MSSISSRQEEEDQFSHPSDDDSYSTGADSGFSVGTEEDEKLQMKAKQEEPVIVIVQETNTAPSFFSRLVSIPIIQDSFTGAQNIVRQHAVGQKALEYAETKLQSMVVQAQPYLPTDNTGRMLSRANSFGNRSLDLLEKQFPSISSPTQELVQPITGRIEFAVSHLKEKKSSVVDARIESLATALESLLDQYLPASEKEQELSEQPSSTNRLLNVINLLSTRASKRISKKVSATNDEEKKMKQIIHAWVLEQVNTMSQQPQVESLVTKFFHDRSPMQVMYNFTQTEFDKVRQELNKPNVSHMDKVRNILVLSQTDILLPLYHSIWTRQPAKVEQVQVN
ncbi:hypothetical protein EDC94DRAFT_626499 [Helicostylum pulchrum]|uniref:Uncharacterized protein n=1 Tax=Helicostylum pulchrum TaxID=562976 RepID=A0ABP9Y8G9_9FUNG|nr:hypothetical protein EDC94DRAFT_626499 [Helicostylum pulchrum]